MKKTSIIAFILIFTFTSCRNSKKVEYSSGGYEIGEFSNGKLNGNGEQYLGKGKFFGDYYKGQFIEGKYNGQGKYYKANYGLTIIGNFKNGKPNGKCEIIFEEKSPWVGTQFQGYWENGLSNEFAKLVSHTPKGKTVYDNPTTFMDTINKCYNISSVPFKQLLNSFTSLNSIVNTNESISKKIFETKQLIALTQKQFDKSIQAIIDIEEYDKEINYKLAVQGVLEHLKIGVNGVILEKIEHLEKGSDEKIKKECEDRLSSFVKEYNTKNSLFTSKRDKFIDRYEVKLW